MLKVRLTLVEEMLGTTPGDPDIAKKYILENNPDGVADDELKALAETEEDEDKKIIHPTIFPVDEETGLPFMWDYQIKGMFKDACGMLRRCDGTESKKIKAYKKIIDGCIFVNPRKILIHDAGDERGMCTRPLRTTSPKGERVAIAISETVPAGAYVEFEVNCLAKAHIPLVTEWLAYGELRGLGAWRNSGKGKFITTVLK